MAGTTSHCASLKPLKPRNRWVRPSPPPPAGECRATSGDTVTVVLPHDGDGPSAPSTLRRVHAPGRGQTAGSAVSGAGAGSGSVSSSSAVDAKPDSSPPASIPGRGGGARQGREAATPSTPA